jgi:hypothetical protein
MVVILALSACSGSATSSKSVKSSSDVKLRPADQLKGISAGLQEGVDSILRPLDEVDGLLLQIEELPTKVNIDLSALGPMFQSAISGGDVVVPESLRVDVQVKNEVEAVGQRFKAIISGLKSTPEKLKELGARIVKALPQIPVLAAQVTATSKVIMANPFASAEAKAQAQADMAALTQIQTDVANKVKEIQKKITTMPQKAQAALNGLTSLAKGTADFSAIRASLPAPEELASSVATEVTASVTAQATSGLTAAAGSTPASAKASVGTAAPSVACLNHCDTVLSACVHHQAPACPTFKRPTGTTADILGKEPPVQGVPWMLSAEPAEVSIASCQTLTRPCAEVQKTCSSTCAGHASKAKIRIFADRGRSLVYLDEKRLGATPEDQLQPFESSDVEAGKHWLRLVSVDSLWQWKGFVEVDPRTDNVFEITLEDAVKARWKRAQDLESGGFLEAAMVAYTEFDQTFPKQSRKARADKKISSLKQQLGAAEKTLASRFTEDKQLDDRTIALAQFYILVFPTGSAAGKAQSTIVSAQAAIAKRAQEQSEQEKLRAQEIAQIEKARKEPKPELALKFSLAYLRSYPNGSFVAEADQIQKDI